MKETYKTVAMWDDGSTTEEYTGKWYTQAHDAGEKAKENGAFYVELETLQNGEVVDSVEVQLDYLRKLARCT